MVHRAPALPPDPGGGGLMGRKRVVRLDVTIEAKDEDMTYLPAAADVAVEIFDDLHYLTRRDERFGYRVTAVAGAPDDLR